MFIVMNRRMGAERRRGEVAGICRNKDKALPLHPGGSNPADKYLFSTPNEY